MNAKLEARRDFGQRSLGAFSARQAIGENADVMAAISLSVGEVEDMAEDSADGGAYRMKDTKRLIRFGRHG